LPGPRAHNPGPPSPLQYLPGLRARLSSVFRTPGAPSGLHLRLTREIRVCFAMVQYRRNHVPGGTFFFTVTLADRRSSALVDYIGLLRNAFRQVRDRKPFAVDAIVVLPDHLHAILTLPSGDPDFPGRWKAIKAAFTRSVVAIGVSIPRNRRGEYALWQRRFWEHTIRDERDFERCADYIHFNPVKHQIVSTPNAWPHSSIHRYIRAGILPEDWGGGAQADDASFGERAI
jgi:putative transposase